MTELICIVCPKGCHLRVDEENNFQVTGHTCARGEEYGKIELTDPRRVITSTVRVSEGFHRRCPVKTSAPIPKGMIFDAMRLLDDVTLTAPVACGQVVASNILGTDVCFVTTRSLEHRGNP